ncbi:MAG TPA: indolepyruvate ferredoxin oxidoreductase subunit alpha [Bacillota bacterium]
MAKQLLMGNEAIARGAIEAGLNFAAAYPGTPSSEIIGSLADWAVTDQNNGTAPYYVEWSVNEKVAMEAAAGAAYAGAYSLVAMKQVGLNVASDPLMSLAYIGIEGALVVVVADDPGPHSSQTEQDTRSFARYANLPVLDPASPEEALEMTKAAFELSHRYHLPVLLRPTTRVCHATAGIEPAAVTVNRPVGFVKDPNWVIFPKLSYLKHQQLEKIQTQLAAEFGNSPQNQLIQGDRVGIVSGGVADLYLREAVALLGIHPTILKIGTPYPAPVQLIQRFLGMVDRVIVVEELDPVLEEAVHSAAGTSGFHGPIHGKLSGDLPYAGEYNVDLIRTTLTKILKPDDEVREVAPTSAAPTLPVRPPVLCAGCPHRASFYAVKQATKGTDAIYTGDIGCYTLGNAAPLEMVDTCLCMGAGLTIAQGLYRVNPGRPVIAFIGDSTFFHTGIPGVLNAVYNNHAIKIMLLDNGTTAMTGHQPHPGIGRNAVGLPAPVIDPAAILKACGVQFVEVVDPLHLKQTEATIRRALEFPGVAAVVLRHPCISLNRSKGKRLFRILPERCTGCRRCLKELGCPAFYREATSEKAGTGGIQIGPSCTGCGLCSEVCASGAIEEVVKG